MCKCCAPAGFPAIIDAYQLVLHISSLSSKLYSTVPHMKNDTSKHELLKLTRYDFFEIGQEQPPSNESTAATDDSDNFRTMTMRALGIKAQAQAKNPIGKMLKGDVHYSLPFGIYLPVDKPTTLGKKTKAGKKDSVLMAVLATDPIHLEGSKNISLSLMGRVVPPPKGSKPSEANTHSAASQLVFDQGPGAVAEEGAHELEERNPQQEALSNFLSRFLRGEANTVFVRGGSPFAAPPNVTSGHDAMNGTDGEAEEPLPGEGSVLPGWLDSALRLVDLPISFPGSKVTDLIKNVTIEDLKITPHRFDTDKLVCSGTVMGVVNLPGQLSTVDVKITHLWPDILVFDGKPPSMQPKPPNSSTNAIGDQMNAEGEDEEPIPPLPDPLPKNAFARVRPHNFAPATTYQDPEDPDRKLLRSELKDVPITVLPGRGPIFRQFAWRIVNGEGALTGIEGKSRAKVWNSGLGTLELKNLPVKVSNMCWVSVARERLVAMRSADLHPFALLCSLLLFLFFKGAFLVGHRGDDAALDDKDETKH